MFHPINLNFGKNLWVRSYRTRRRKRWHNTLVSPASKGWAYDQPTSKPISLHFPKHITLSYFGIEKSWHNTWSTTFQKKTKNIFAWCPCPMNQLAWCQNFQKPISTTFPAFLWKSTIYAKLSEIISKTPTSFRDFFGGWEFHCDPCIIASHHLGGDSPCPPRHQANPRTQKQRHTSISPPQSSEIRAGNWPPKPAGAGCRCPWWWKSIPRWLEKKQQNKYMTWDSPPEWHYMFEFFLGNPYI